MSHRALAPFKHSGHSLPSWLRLLARNRMALDWRCWPAALATTGLCGLQSVLNGVQKLRYGRAVAHTVVRDPIFAIGHWRSGTSLLHELLTLDARHAAPTLYSCLQPRHFLLTERWVQIHLAGRWSARRVMDDMHMRSDSPFEDEFALMFLGQPSPYEFLAFPKRAGTAPNYFDLVDLPAARRSAWQRTLRRFVQELSHFHGRRIVLKSPLHSARIPDLLEVFPGATFVHIVRNPFTVFASTVHMWRSVSAWFGMQRPGLKNLDQRVLDDYVRLYTRLEEGRQLVAPERFCELRYEDLIAEPKHAMKKVYSALDLRAFDSVKPAIESYFSSRHDYQTNRYSLSRNQVAMIERRWGKFIREFGYVDALSMFDGGIHTLPA